MTEYQKPPDMFSFTGLSRLAENLAERNFLEAFSQAIDFKRIKTLDDIDDARNWVNQLSFNFLGNKGVRDYALILSRLLNDRMEEIRKYGASDKVDGLSEDWQATMDQLATIVDEVLGQWLRDAPEQAVNISGYEKLFRRIFPK